VILVDANLLIYAVNSDSPHHAASRRWWEDTLSGTQEVGLAWIVILAFIRITTRAGILTRPMTPQAAITYVDEWLSQPYVHLVDGPKLWSNFRNLQLQVGTAGSLTSDTLLATLAMELGATIYSADYDFQRFTGLSHENPLAASRG
jgi:uncharacterized protein